MSGSPLVSVLFTSYNHAPFVERALDSILAQDLDDYELFISDDCSVDGSADVIRAWLARTGVEAVVDLRDRNIGLCAGRNRTLAQARGTFVACLSGDDWYEPDRLSRQVAFFREQADDVAAVYSDVRVVNEDGSVRLESYLTDLLGSKAPPDGWVFADLHRGNVLPAQGVMMRRSALAAVGGYDENLAFEDWDMWLRLADRFRFRFADLIAANRRELADSMGHAGYRTPHFHRSIVRLNERWLGRDETARLQSAHWMRHSALVIAQEDAAEARSILRRVADVPSLDHVPWRAVEAALAVPGVHRTVLPARRLRATGSRLLSAEIGAWRAGRRLPRRRAEEADVRGSSAS